MKVTKRQLRRIIREEKARLNEQYDRDPSPGYDYDPDSDPAQRALADMEHMQYEEYKTWAKETGQVTPAASSVMATYFVEQGLTDDAAQIGMMASGYGIDPQDVMRDIKRQQAEYDAGGVLSDEEDYERGFRESISRRGSKLLNESLQSQEEALFNALDQYVMVLDEKMGYDVPQEHLKAEVLNFVDGYFQDAATGFEQEGY